MNDRRVGWLLAGAIAVSLLAVGVGLGPATAVQTDPGSAVDLSNDATTNGSTAAAGSGDRTEFRGARITGSVSDLDGNPVEDSVVWVERVTFPTDASRNTTIVPDEQTRFEIEPTGGLAASAVDDPSDTFEIARQQWNGRQWVDTNRTTVDRATLADYTFPASDFPGFDLDLTSTGGLELVEIVELSGGANPDATYTLDPVPAVRTETGAASTEYSVRGIKLTAPHAGATRSGGAELKPGARDRANIVFSVTLQEPNLQVTNLTAPRQATVGDTVTVRADVTNTGDVAVRSRTVELRYDVDGDGTLDSDETLATRTLDLDPGVTRPVRFDVSTGGLAPGTSTIGVVTGDDTASAPITLQSSVTFGVSNLRGPTSTPRGDSVTVAATVTNTGSTRGTETVEFRVDGSTVDSERVTLGAGASQGVSFGLDTASLAPGIYTYGVYSPDDSATASLRVQRSATFDVSTLDGPVAATQGDTATVTATVTNTGSVRGDGTVELRVGGSTADSDRVSLGAGASQSVSLSLDTASLSPGIYTYGAFTADSSRSGFLHVTGTSAAGVNRTAPGTVGTGGTGTVTVSATTTSSGPFSLTEQFSGPVVGATVRGVTVDGTPANPRIERANDSVATVAFGSLPANTTVEVTYDLAVANTPGDVVVSDRAGGSATRIRVLDLGPFADLERRVPDSVATGGTAAVTLSATLGSSGGPFSLTEAFQGPVTAGSIRNVTVDGTPVSPVLSQADSNGATVTLSGVPAGGVVEVTYGIEAAGSPGSISVSGNVTSGSQVSLGSDSISVRSCSLSTLVIQYDTNGDCAISVTELGGAGSDYATGKLTVVELGRVGAAYARQS